MSLAQDFSNRPQRLRCPRAQRGADGQNQNQG